MMKNVVITYAIETPCAVTEMKYCPGVPMWAPNGLRTHICQVPRKAAIRNAPNATQKCVRQSRSTLRTGDPPVPIRLEFAFRHDLNVGPHVAVAQTAILMTGHEQVSGLGEFGVHLRDKAGHYHRIHIDPGNEESVDDVRCREAQGDAPSSWDRDAMRNEHELGGNAPYGEPTVRA